jgi:hypothetical protein
MEFKMSTTQQDKSSGKPRQHKRKADQPGPKPEQQQSPILNERKQDQIDPVVASAPTNSAATPADNFPISIQTIANAYGDYTRKSLLESRFFVEKLLAVRSLDKAIEVHTEFARQTYANFVAESQKIGELYREFAGQTFQPWGFAAKMTEAGLASWPATASQSQH